MVTTVKVKARCLEQRSRRPEVGGERLQSQRKKGEKSANHTNVRAKSLSGTKASIYALKGRSMRTGTRLNFGNNVDI